MTAPKPKPSAAVIVGLGRTGLSAARYLHARGWRLAVTDTRVQPPELERLRELDPNVPVRLGGLDAQLLDDALCVVASPGVSLAEPFFAGSMRRWLASPAPTARAPSRRCSAAWPSAQV
jgi:UDP-N-acetylmuramoylalanine--D-glutamate ligase